MISITFQLGLDVLLKKKCSGQVRPTSGQVDSFNLLVLGQVEISIISTPLLSIKYLPYIRFYDNYLFLTQKKDNPS